MPETRSVLVVDDDDAMREMLLSLLEAGGFAPEGAATADLALEAAGAREFDAVLSDIRMPGRDGFELLGELRERRPETPVILMTAFGSIDSAVEAMRAGAFDYITKPFKRDAVLATLERAIERRELEAENRRLRRAVDQTSSFGDLIGTSPAMREIFALIRKISSSRSSVLITGESGTGKEVVARTIHFTGNRAQRPFVPVNCTAMPEGLLESELFGHARGAFTGAHTAKRGLFEEADGGTLFLDEIGDMPAVMQGKLLRVLQDQQIRPVGANKSVSVDVRIITATNRDLKMEIDEGRFRNDLFYRLNVIPIHIPPLRERPEDIPALAQAFARKHGGPGASIPTEAMKRLTQLPWEGNARELENAIERALALSGGETIEMEMLPPLGREGSVGEEESLLDVAVKQKLTLRELGDLYVDRVLASVNRNKVHAARILGINRRTLYRRGESDSASRHSEAQKESVHDRDPEHPRPH